MSGGVIERIRRVWTHDGDTDSDEARSLDRYRRALATTGMNYAEYAVGVVGRIVSVPLILGYVGTERYGVWVALSGFAALLLVADFGVGAGLQNALADCHGRGDRRSPRSYVAGTVLLSGTIWLAFTAAALFALPRIDVAAWLEAPSEAARREALPTAQVLLLVFAFGIPASLVQRMHNAFQEGYRAKAWVTAGRLAALAGVVACVVGDLGLPLLAAAHSGLPIFALALAAIHLFRTRPWLLPSVSSFEWRAFRRVTRSGIGALGTRFGLLLANSAVPILIANRLGAEEVPAFSVTMSLLWFPVMMVSMATFSLWPAYSEAASRGDHAWISKAFRRSAGLAAVVMIPVAVVVPLAGPWVIRIWTGNPDVVPGIGLLLACTAWSLLFTWSSVCMVLLNGLDRMGLQAIYGVGAAAIALLVAWNRAPSSGVAGVAWTLVVVCGIPWALFYSLDARARLRALRRESPAVSPR